MIFHDLKSSNVIVDEEFNVQLFHFVCCEEITDKTEKPLPSMGSVDKRSSFLKSFSFGDSLSFSSFIKDEKLGIYNKRYNIYNPISPQIKRNSFSRMRNDKFSYFLRKNIFHSKKSKENLKNLKKSNSYDDLNLLRASPPSTPSFSSSNSNIFFLDSSHSFFSLSKKKRNAFLSENIFKTQRGFPLSTSQNTLSKSFPNSRLSPSTNSPSSPSSSSKKKNSLNSIKNFLLSQNKSNDKNTTLPFKGTKGFFFFTLAKNG